MHVTAGAQAASLGREAVMTVEASTRMFSKVRTGSLVMPGTLPTRTASMVSQERGVHFSFVEASVILGFLIYDYVAPANPKGQASKLAPESPQEGRRRFQHPERCSIGKRLPVLVNAGSAAGPSVTWGVGGAGKPCPAGAGGHW